MISDLLKPGLTELGKIKIGGLGETRTSKKGGTYRLPQKFDHFVLTTMQRSQSGDLVADKRLMDELVKKCGDADGKLRRIPIVLLSDDIDDVLQVAWCWYSGKKCIARCDDGQAIIWSDPSNPNLAKWRERFGEEWNPSYADVKDGNGNPTFRFHTTLNCVVASTEGRWGGVYKMRSSRISGQQLYDSLTNISTLTGGFLRGIPMWLVVRPIVVTPKVLNGASSTVYVVHCELHGADLLSVQQHALQLAEAQQKHAVRIRAITVEYQKLLSSPGKDESDEDQERIQDEFAPEHNGSAPVAAVVGGDDPLMAGIGSQEPELTEQAGAAAESPPAQADETCAELAHRIDHLAAGDSEGAKLIAADMAKAKEVIGEDGWMNLNDKLIDKVRESELGEQPPF